MARKKRRTYYGSRRQRVQRRQKVLIAIVLLGVIGAGVKVFIWPSAEPAVESMLGGADEDSNAVATVDADDNTITMNEPINVFPKASRSQNIVTPAVNEARLNNITVVTPDSAPVNVESLNPVVPIAEAPMEPAETLDAINATPAVASRSSSIFSAGKAAFDNHKYILASQTLTQALESSLSSQERQAANEMINDASDQWLFTPKVFKEDTSSQKYRVVSGDNLKLIGNHCAVPYKLIMKINGIRSPQHLRADKDIKIIKGPFNAKVYLSRFETHVYLNDIIVRVYGISTGAPGHETPTGKWHVGINKQVNPKWYDELSAINGTKREYLPDDPENPLGERWIPLVGIEGEAKGRTGFGIHGTIEPDKIGQAVSRGCVRLTNENVESLYDLLQSSRSMVTIVK